MEWKAKQSDAATAEQGLQRRIEVLRDQRKKLVDAYVYESAVPKDVYQEELTRLGDEIESVREQWGKLRAEGLDVERLLDQAESLALNASQLWQSAKLDHRVRLQRLLFPAGLSYGEGAFRTPLTGLFFSHLEEDTTAKVKSGDPGGIRTRDLHLERVTC